MQPKFFKNAVVSWSNSTLICYKISWFLDTIMWILDFSLKSSNTYLQCTAPWAFYDISSSLCILERTADIWDISISLSLHASLASLAFLHSIWYPLRNFEMNTDIWDLSISTPPYTMHCTLRKSFFNYCHYFLPQPVPATTDPPNHLFRWKEIWHFRLRCHMWKIKSEG